MSMVNEWKEPLLEAQDERSHLSSFDEMRDLIINLIHKNQHWRSQQCINLVAAESLMSEASRSLLSSDLSMRMAGGLKDKNRPFMGTQWIDQIDSLTREMLNFLFKCHFCEPRLFGGTQACQIIYSTMTRPGDTIMAVMPSNGGDSCHTEENMTPGLSLQVIPIPFLADHLTIDLNELDNLVSRYKPKLISIGFSISLFEQPLSEIQKIAHQHGVTVFYDAAHELGLIAGGCFKNPFLEGIDIVSGCTGKTFSGPQGGLLLWNNEIYNDVFGSNIYPTFIGTYPLNRLSALALSVLELIYFGKTFMSNIISNAQCLALELSNLGVDVFAKEKNFTATHQIVLNAETYGGGFKAAKRLEKCHMMTNPVNLPGDRSLQRKGIRLATTEITRRGMSNEEMKQIASLISRALLTAEPADLIAREAEGLIQAFSAIHYCH